MTIVGLVLLVVGLAHIIAGVVLYEQNVKNRTEQQWYVWLLLGLGIVVTIVGVVLMIVGIRKSKKITVTSSGKFTTGSYQPPPYEMGGLPAYTTTPTYPGLSQPFQPFQPGVGTNYPPPQMGPVPLGGGTFY